MAGKPEFVIQFGCLTAYKGKDKDVIIPDGVTAIGRRAFYYNKEIETVTIPESVDTVEQEAFQYCTALHTITILGTIKKAGKYAFGSFFQQEALELSVYSAVPIRAFAKSAQDAVLRVFSGRFCEFDPNTAVFRDNLQFLGTHLMQPREYSNKLFCHYLAENDTMFSLTMAVEKLLGGYRHDWIEDGRLAVCILQLEEGKEWDAERFAAQFRELTASMNVRAVLGRPVKAFRELSQEYFDATNAMIYLQTVSESGLMPLTEYRAMMSNPSVMKESRWQKLLEDIQSGDTERTADDVKEIFGGHRIRNARIPVLKMQLAGRLNEIMTLYCENNPAQDVAQTFFPGMEAFLKAQNLEEMQKSFQALAVMTARGIDRSDTMADQVCAYVQEHYADPDLNISYLAEVFHRNPQTLSRLFRAQKGQGLLDYISMVRVDRARELIRTGDASLEKIAGMVGFTNVRTFRRAFVKQYGMLPSEM